MRSTSETIELDQSLRQARGIYVALAAFLAPFAFGGVLSILASIAGLVESGTMSPGAVVETLFALLAIGAEYVMIGQCLEANRRLKALRENPEQKVRKMSAPFQSSLFGPYH